GARRPPPLGPLSTPHPYVLSFRCVRANATAKPTLLLGWSVHHIPGVTTPPMQGPSNSRPLAVKVRDLYKRFRLPGHRPETFKEQAIRPFRQSPVRRELKVLNGISFELERGRFLGILGRNGSGKSTLLKLIASIYRPDSGEIWVSGRLAPVIELGVGFQPELPARENVIL